MLTMKNPSFLSIVQNKKKKIIDYMKYELEVSTSKHALIYPNSYKIDSIGQKDKNKVYEITVSKPGIIDIKLNKCFGTVVVNRFWGIRQIGGNDKIFHDVTYDNNK